MSINIIEKVLIRLIQENVFYSSLISQMRRICVDENHPLASSIHTAAVSIRNGRIELYWNPKFFETLTLVEAKAVLEHEALHLVFDHINRKEERDHQLWNIATDLAINQMLDGLPKEGITLDKFPATWKLPIRERAELYYSLMEKHANKIEFSQTADGKTKATIKDASGKVIGEIELEGPGSHEEWQNGDPSELSKEVVRQAVKEAHDEYKKAKNQGNLPHDLEEAIADLLKPPVISWKALLRRFVAASIKSGHKLSWKRPNRRFGEVQKGHLPDRTVSITVAVDTSGSISNSDFQMMIAELRSIMSVYRGTITMIECDAEVQKEYKLRRFGKVDTQFKGRGGTDFRPVFTYIKDKGIKTDVLLYFTDLYGTFPENKPSYPVVWVATISLNEAYHKVKVPFGIPLSIPDHTPDIAKNKKS